MTGAEACGRVYLPGFVVSASAFSSQYVIPISRYILVAVEKCSCACSLAETEVAVRDEGAHVERAPASVSVSR
jgi:hypothetical protein